MLILYKFSLFNINRSYIVRNYGVAATFLGTSPSNRIVVTIETAIAIEDELNIIVDEGAEIIDVIIEHPIYGELKGNLHLSTRREVKQFIESTKKFNAPLLSNLSHGVHLHTLKIKDQDTLKRIEEALIKENILYTKEDELKEGESYE